MQKLYKRIRDGPDTIKCCLVWHDFENLMPHRRTPDLRTWNGIHAGCDLMMRTVWMEPWLPGNRVQGKWFESSRRLQAVVSGDSVIE